MNPDDIKYHREHAWVRAEGKRATIGITDYAQQQMGDIVYIDLPEVDTEIDADSELSEVESTKATSPVVSPVSGMVAEVNEDLADSPEMALTGQTFSHTSIPAHFEASMYALGRAGM